jgi:hypothetical protein
MKARNRKSSRATKEFRTFNFHARFTPEGPDGSDRLAFFDFFLAAICRAGELKDKELGKRKSRFAKLQAARRRADPILIKVLHNQIPVEMAIQKIKRLVPDKEMLQQLFDVWEKKVNAKPEQVAKEKEDIASRELEIAKSGRLHKARKAILDGMTTLAEAAEAGDAKAVEYLAEAAIETTGLLHIVERKQPRLLGTIARGRMLWPVLASSELGWEKDSIKRIERLELGADLHWYKVPFRKARGTDANLPARLWAKAAVRTIEETRFRILSFGQILHEFGSNQGLADFCMETGWRIGKEPEWAHDVVGLKRFSRESLPEWKLAIRKMIREQMRNLHTCPEWSTQRNTAEASGRTTPGEINNAILDDITSALDRLVPDSGLPKSTC